MWFASSDAHRGWDYSDEAPRYDPADVIVPPYLFDGPKTHEDLADYYHEVSRTDHFAGQLRKELERQGIAEKTYFVYCADNGRPFPRAKTAAAPILVAVDEVFDPDYRRWGGPYWLQNTRLPYWSMLHSGDCL